MHVKFYIYVKAHLEYIYKEIWFNKRVKAQTDLVRGYTVFQTR